jgi:hypothetical protein
MVCEIVLSQQSRFYRARQLLYGPEGGSIANRH